MPPDAEPDPDPLRPVAIFEVVRVSWGFYTWHFEYGEDVRVGWGPRAAAIRAADSWIRRHGGTSNVLD